MSDPKRELTISGAMIAGERVYDRPDLLRRLETALAESALKSLRILELEKELAAIKPTRRERLIEQDRAIDAMQGGGGE